MGFRFLSLAPFATLWRRVGELAGIGRLELQCIQGNVKRSIRATVRVSLATSVFHQDGRPFGHSVHSALKPHTFEDKRDERSHANPRSVRPLFPGYEFM